MSCPEGLDRIDVTGIRGRGWHGVFAAEREQGQTFTADVSLGLNLQSSAQTADLACTVDYGRLTEQIHAVIGGEPVELIETVCLRMVDLCLEYPHVQWVSVTVHKPEAPIAVAFDDVAVTIERRQT